jgi:hypothetical protein
VEAFFEPHSSATGRKKSLHWGEKMFLGASKEFLNNFHIKHHFSKLKQYNYEVENLETGAECVSAVRCVDILRL